MNFTDLDLAILKTITTNKKYAIDFASDYDSKIFSSDVWNFANLVIPYIKNFKEVPTLRVLTEKLAKGNNSSIIDYCNVVWKKIEDFKYDDREFKFDLEKIKTRYSERQLTEVRELLNKGDLNKLDIEASLKEIDRKVQNIKSLKKTKAYERRTLKDHIPIFRDKFNEKLKDPNFDQGLMTGYSFLDSATGGLRSGELLLIGGESGGGKSMFLMNMAIQLWMQSNTIETPKENFKPGVDVLYFSLEMPYGPCFDRVLSRLSKVPSKHIRQPVTPKGKRKISKEDAAKIKSVFQFIDHYPNEFEIIDIPRGATVQQVELLFEEARSRCNPRVVVIDYLGIMDDDSQDDDWLKLGIIAGKIHELGRAQGLIILSAVQLNRSKSGKDSEDKVGMHRIGRSALIMTHANIGIQIETRQNEKQFPDMKYHLIKNRDGEMGSALLIKNLACGTLLDSPIKEDEDVGYSFTDVDDISEKMEELDI